MFMRNNRAKNGAVQPEATAKADAAAQKAAEKLSPNDYDGLKSADWRFQATLSTCAQINEEHYIGGLKDDGVYQNTYESKVPFVGTEPPEGNDRVLKDR